MNEGSHPDLELLSDLSAGVLPSDRRDDLERHLEHCPSCLARLDSLVEVQGALRMVGAERTEMPTAVTARLTDAIRQEAGTAETAGPEAGGSDVTGADPLGAAAESTGTSRDSRHVVRTSSSGRQRRTGRGRRADLGDRGDRARARPSRRSRLARGLAVAAGVAVLAVGGTIGYQTLLAESPEQQPSASDRKDQDGGGDDHAYALTDDSLRLTEQDFDTQLRGAVVPRSEAGPGGSGPGVNGDTDPPSSNDGTRPGRTTPPEMDTRNDDGAGVAQPDRCVRDVLSKATDSADSAEPAESLLDIESVRFDGEPALLAITPGSKSGTVHAWAISGCPSDGTLAYDAEVPVAE